MNFRWGLTITANVLLTAALYWRRPRGLQRLWVQMHFVLFCTAWNVYAWYHVSDALYNRVWGILDKIQFGFELLVAIGFLRDLIESDSFADAACFVALMCKLYVWICEYWTYNPYDFADGWALMLIRKNLNFAVIAVELIAVYTRTKRNPRDGESECLTNSTSTNPNTRTVTPTIQRSPPSL